MQNKYAQIAIKAFAYLNEGLEAEKAWEKASCEFYKKGSSSQIKGCPRNAFLGLTSKKPSIEKSKNALYARKALKFLRENQDRKYSVNELWSKIIDKPIVHNSQMNVVLALWDNKLIK